MIQDPEFQYKEEGKKLWQKLHDHLFEGKMPQEGTWKGNSSIPEVLNTICSIQDSCITFLPGGGQLDLKGANISKEEGCIELDFTTPALVKPDRLTFYSFGGDIMWNYFRLISTPIEPVLAGIEYHSPETEYYEPVQEVSIFKYGKVEDKEMELSQRYAYSKSNRLVNRYFRGGDFVLLCNGAPYNDHDEADSALHQSLGEVGFKNYILSFNSKNHF